MPRPIEQLPQIRAAITFYRVMSWVTGIFLLLLVAEMVLKYSPTHVEIFAFGASGPLALEAVVPGAGCQWYSLFVPGGMGCEIPSLGTGFNISLTILIVLLVVLVSWMGSDERRARTLDRAADRSGDAELNAYNARLRACRR